MAQADTIIPPGVQGLDRYAYANNSPLNFVDPSGHEPGTMCDKGYTEYCPDGIPSETEDTPLVIGGCGVGAGGDCQNTDQYGGVPSLEPFIEWAENNGFDYVRFGIDPFIGKGTSKGDMAKAIFELIKFHDGKIYLVGHSAGADAIILAVDMAIENGLQDKIAGVAIIDPYFQRDGGGSLQTEADRIASNLPPGSVFLADGIPGDGIDVSIAGSRELPYNNDHFSIAVNVQVLLDFASGLPR